MAQVDFAASTPAAALRVGPYELDVSQHAGGERSVWTDTKLQKDGTHPVIYDATGSHANYFAHPSLAIRRAGAAGAGGAARQRGEDDVASARSPALATATSGGQIFRATTRVHADNILIFAEAGASFVPVYLVAAGIQWVIFHLTSVAPLVALDGRHGRGHRVSRHPPRRRWGAVRVRDRDRRSFRHPRRAGRRASHLGWSRLPTRAHAMAVAGQRHGDRSRHGPCSYDHRRRNPVRDPSLHSLVAVRRGLHARRPARDGIAAPRLRTGERSLVAHARVHGARWHACRAVRSAARGWAAARDRPLPQLHQPRSCPRVHVHRPVRGYPTDALLLRPSGARGRRHRG